MYSNLTLLQMAKKQMDWSARRQEVLSQNVANADTPKYQAQDLTPLDFKQALSQTQPVLPTVTNPMHIATIPPLSADPALVKATSETSPDGNAVNLEEQMQKVGETRNRFEVATTLFSKHMRMLKTSLGRGGGG